VRKLKTSPKENLKINEIKKKRKEKKSCGHQKKSIEDAMIFCQHYFGFIILRLKRKARSKFINSINLVPKNQNL
jgi:hypothetical protein